MDLAASKSSMRKRMRKDRAGIPGRDREVVAERIADIGASVLSGAPFGMVAFFHSWDGEVDTLPLAQRLHDAGHRLCLPVVAGKGLPLTFRLWWPGMLLIPGEYGICIPPDSAPPAVPDLVLTPFLAFDSQGYRLGYGRGYYDRTIAGLRGDHPVEAVGLGFALQEVKRVPHGRHDVRLDAVVTEGGYVRFHP